jgi:hypothetical protein
LKLRWKAYYHSDRRNLEIRRRMKKKKKHKTANLVSIKRHRQRNRSYILPWLFAICYYRKSQCGNISIGLCIMRRLKVIICRIVDDIKWRIDCCLCLNLSGRRINTELIRALVLEPSQQRNLNNAYSYCYSYSFYNFFLIE